MKTILFYGNFGNNSRMVTDGQTSKTINFFNQTKEFFPKQTIYCFNTDNFLKKRITNFFKLKKAIKKSDIIVIFPGSVNSLRVFMFACSFTKKTVFYPVVGGWIADKIKKSKKLIKFLRKMHGIYPETNGLKNKLAELGICNTKISPTFTLRKPIGFDLVAKEYLSHKKTNEFKFVYFGRIIETKGIYLAIDAIKEINSTKDFTVKLDFFGTKNNTEDYSRFEKMLDDNIKYFGEMRNEDVWTLCRYDYFLFPSFYPGEGLPACCIESLLYGTPIIASDWRYNSEMIIEKKNGFLFSLENNNLKNVILEAISNKYDILSMKKNAFIAGKSYYTDIAIKPFLDDLTEALKDE